LWLVGALTIAAAVGAQAQTKVDLPDPSVGHRVTNTYDRSDFEVELTVNYRQRGTILDTVGLNGAPLGSFSLVVGGDGKVSFNVYDPPRQGPLRLANGWHTLANPAVTAAGKDHRIVLRVSGGKVVLRVDAELTTADCPTPLSGQPVYVGDFKGDEHWGEKLHIHQGMVGTVILRYWGRGRQTAPTSGAGPAPPAGGAVEPGVLIDETGTVSAAEKAQVLALLSQLRTQKGLSLGLVVATGQPDGVVDKADSYRMAMLRQGLLPPESGLIAFCGQRIAYQFSMGASKQLSFAQVGAAWQTCAGLPAGQALVKLATELLKTATGAGRAPDPAPTANPPITPASPTGPQTGAAADAAQRLEAALKAGDLAGATALVSPEVRDLCGQLLRDEPQAAARLAAVLATRRLVAQGARTAQFEVTDNGRRYPVTFLNVDGQWLLASF
jgi:hypothetical protein